MWGGDREAASAEARGAGCSRLHVEKGSIPDVQKLTHLSNPAAVPHLKPRVSTDSFKAGHSFPHSQKLNWKFGTGPHPHISSAQEAEEEVS